MDGGEREVRKEKEMEWIGNRELPKLNDVGQAKHNKKDHPVPHRREKW